MRATRKFICLLALLGLPATGPAADAHGETPFVSCEQHEFESLECDYRIPTPETQLGIDAAYEGRSLPLEQTRIYPWDNAVTAILFLIDTSDPARKKVVEIKKKHIQQILRSKAPHHRIGLASFDKRLTIAAPIGAASSEITAALASIKTAGRTTELYRNTIKAIGVLRKSKANRKVIFLLSDGLAEDKAYFHEDVIKAAHQSNIIINSIGYPRSLSLSVALQTIRRLSEETGGEYVEVDGNYELQPDYIKTAFDNIDTGGQILIRLNGIKPNRSLLAHELTLTFNTDKGGAVVSVPFKLPSAKIAETALAKKEQASTPITAQQNKPQPINLWLWYGPPAALIIVTLLVLATLLILWKRDNRPGKSPRDRKPEYKPYAYLIKQDETAACYPVTKTIWRIGRGRDNELSLDDNSISRRHAELHRNQNGDFDIIDLESANGVYVNNKKVLRHTLNEGDILEIGDIFLRFSSFSVEHLQEERTIMQKTKLPEIN